MLQRITQIIDSASGLLEIRAQLALRQAEQAASSVLFRFALGSMIALGAITVLAAITVVLAREWGTAEALATVGGFVLVCGTVVRLFGRSPATPGTPVRLSEAELRAQAERRSLELQELASLAPDNESARKDDLGGLSSDLFKSLLKRPDTIASAAFAVVGIFGPGQTLRMLGKVASLVTIASSVVKAVNDIREPKPSAPQHPGTGAGPGPRAEPVAGPGGVPPHREQPLDHSNSISDEYNARTAAVPTTASY